jgi:hypothetical protein
MALKLLVTAGVIGGSIAGYVFFDNHRKATEEAHTQNWRVMACARDNLAFPALHTDAVVNFYPVGTQYKDSGTTTPLVAFDRKAGTIKLNDPEQRPLADRLADCATRNRLAAAVAP